MTIAVAHNDSAEGRAALLHAAREAIFQHRSLAVLHIIDGMDLKSGAREAGALQAEIGRALSEAGLDRVEWTLHSVHEDTSRASALIDLTTEVGADLLVVGSRRRSPIGKFLLGSTIQRLVLDAPVPVLVVKAPQADASKP